MIYDIAKEKDFDQVFRLWKKEQRALGIPFKQFIQEYIDSKELFVIRDDDENIVAMCSFDKMKRLPEIRLALLVVVPEFRGLGLSKILIRQVYDYIKPFLLDHPNYVFLADAREGEANNTFYDKISVRYELSQKKTMNIRRYILDIEKIKSFPKKDWCY